MQTRRLIFVCAALALGLVAADTTVHWDAYFSFDYWGDEPRVFYDAVQGYARTFPIVHDSNRTDNGAEITTDCKFGRGAVQFRGADMGVLTAGVPMAYASTFSVSFWLKVVEDKNNDMDDRVLLSTSHYGIVLAVLLNRNNSVQFAARLGDSAWIRTVPSGHLDLDQWVHIAIVKNGPNWVLYIDGSRMGDMHTEQSFYAMHGVQSVYFMGVPNGDHVNAAFSAAIMDNLRICYCVLTDAQVMDLYHNDQGAPDVTDCPNKWAADVELHTMNWDGSFTVSAKFTGSVQVDVDNERSAVRLTDEKGNVQFRYLFGSLQGQLALTITRPDRQGTPVCVWSQADMCPEFPRSCVCRHMQDDCYSTHCPGNDFWVFNMNNYRQVPIACTKADDGNIRCEETVDDDEQVAVLNADGVLVSSHMKSCSPSVNQGSMCRAVDHAFSNIKIKANATLDLFDNDWLDHCTDLAGFQDAFCNHHGHIDSRGHCACNDGYSGDRCRAPTACQLTSWSAWSTCSKDCGGTQYRTAHWTDDNASNNNGGPSTTTTTTSGGPDTGNNHNSQAGGNSANLGNNVHAGTVNTTTNNGNDNASGNCPGGEIRQTRDCGHDVCTTQCSNCVGGTSGPCQNPHNKVCYAFYEGTQTCPAGTQACGPACTDCKSSSVGPCRHENDGTCVAYTAGTQTCPAGSGIFTCPPAEDKAACTGCWPNTFGPCKQNNTVCWQELPWGGCPTGTYNCSAAVNNDSAYDSGSNVVWVNQTEERRPALVVLQFKLEGVCLAEFIERHAHDFEEACRRHVGDRSITVIIDDVHGNAEGAFERNDDGTWRASTNLDISVLLARANDQGGSRTLVDAGASLAAAASNGQLTATLSAHAVPINTVALGGSPRVIEAESAAAATANADAGASAGAAAGGSSTNAGGSASVSATIVAVLGVWGIVLIAVGLIMMLSLIAVAAILVHHRRRSMAAAAAAAAPAAPAATAGAAEAAAPAAPASAADMA